MLGSSLQPSHAITAASLPAILGWFMVMAAAIYLSSAAQSRGAW